MWIPGLLFEDTKGTERPSQTPENMGYFREYHKACERKTGNQVGTLPWCRHDRVERTRLSAAVGLGWDFCARTGSVEAAAILRRLAPVTDESPHWLSLQTAAVG